MVPSFRSESAPAGRPGRRHLFLVAAIEQRSFGEGRECIVLTLSDAGGRIDTAPFWGARQHLVAGIATGAVVQVAGEIQTYRGRQQLEVSRLAPAPEPSDPASLLPSAGDPAPRWAPARPRGAPASEGPRLSAVLALFYEDAEFRRRYGQCPASTAGHHATIGGLLQHTCEVAAIGLAIAGDLRRGPRPGARRRPAARHRQARGLSLVGRVRDSPSRRAPGPRRARAADAGHAGRWRGPGASLHRGASSCCCCT